MDSAKHNNRLPRISFGSSTSTLGKQYICIKVNGDEIHKVTNGAEFYAALGYTEEEHRRGFMPDEYVWATYTAANSSKTQADLQVKIIEYLSNHSAAFIKQYGDQYKGWIEIFGGKTGE